MNLSEICYFRNKQCHPGFKNKKTTNKIKDTLNSKYTFLILSKIYQGYRPSQIGDQLRISPQLVNYHMDNLIDLDWIIKTGDRQGVRWDLTTKGLLILKQKLTWSVNPFKSNPKGYRFALKMSLSDLKFMAIYMTTKDFTG